MFTDFSGRQGVPPFHSLRFGQTARQKLAAHKAWLPGHIALLSEKEAAEPLDLFRKVKRDVQSPPRPLVIKQPGQNVFMRMHDKLGFTLRHDPKAGDEKPQGFFSNDMQHQDHFQIRTPEHTALKLRAFEKLAAQADGAQGFRYLYAVKGLPGARIERRQLIDKNGQLLEKIIFHNKGPQAAHFRIEMGTLGNDLFHARFPRSETIRTSVRNSLQKLDDNSYVMEAVHAPKHPAPKAPEADLHNVIRTTYSLEPGSTGNLTPVDPTMLHLSVNVPPGESIPVGIQVKSSSTRFGEPAVMPPAYEQTWDSFGTSIAVTSVRKGMSHLPKMWETSFKDLRALTIPVKCGNTRFFPAAAGVPNFVSLFGRDSLISAMQTVQLNPLLARDTLAALAYYQGQKVDEYTEEEPGKILHEFRIGEVTRLGITPHRRYYGTIDATPLFVMLFDEYLGRTHDTTLQRVLWPNFEAALGWIDANVIDKPGHPLEGFLTQRDSEEESGSPIKLKNIGWKDSEASTRHLMGADGKLKYAKYPLALAEVQAYVYGAWRGAEKLYREKASQTDDGTLKNTLLEKSARYGQKADALRKRFNEKFWMPEQNFVAMALQADGEPLKSVSSNGAQALVSGILDEEKAARMVPRLMREDMVSGWGVRTLSAESPAYDPISYHNGPIWPHDNSLIVKGLVRYGYKSEANSIAIATQLLEAGRKFPENRLPELYAGMTREKFDRSILPYPNTCSPQAWAAGTTPLLMASMLGLQVDEQTRTVTFNHPVLPAGVRDMELTVGVIPAVYARTPEMRSEEDIRTIEQLNHANLNRIDVVREAEKIRVQLTRQPDGTVQVRKTGGAPDIRVVTISIDNGAFH